ncbi:MAG: hypothetical protein QXU94_05145 [Thermoplasmata archaeon]
MIVLTSLLVSSVVLADFIEYNKEYIPFDNYRMEPSVSGKYAEPRSDIGIQQIYNVYIPTTHFYQKDEKWKDDIMEWRGQTLGDAGCIVTSFAMNMRSYGRQTDPKRANIDMGNSSNPFVWNDAPNKAGWGLVYLDTLEWDASREVFYNIALNALLDGVPVIVGYEQATSNRPHYVLVNYLYGTGYNLSDYWVTDPDSSSSSLIRLSTLVGDRPLRNVAVYPPK